MQISKTLSFAILATEKDMSQSILHFNKVLQIQLEQKFIRESIPDINFSKLKQL